MRHWLAVALTLAALAAACGPSDRQADPPKYGVSIGR
jgi:hypothetical protein